MFGYGNQRLGWTACLLSAILVLTASGMVAWASQDDEERETFVAFAVNMSNVGPGGSSTIQITIDRWSTDEERQQLIDALVEEGSEELLKVLQKQEETGFIRGQGAAARLNPFPSTRLRYARDMEVDGKRIIRLATDRPIGFREAVQNPRTMDSSFPSNRLQNRHLAAPVDSRPFWHEWCAWLAGVTLSEEDYKPAGHGR